MIDIQLQNEAVDIAACIEWVRTPTSGGVDVFIGTVRDTTKGKKVLALDFEAYAAMALSEMKKIADEVITKWPVDRILIHHRIGKLSVGEVPVVIAVSAAHRDAAFDACRYAIDTLKKTVPIFKKEIFEDGEVWVSAHP
ncbi:MAG: molybdenum cofactor biosynthesis protein MoaE [Bacteroidetes bacterium]|nr:molybdenum cofactor biosynthesis protein MoaE [Bacteroidota bacterium]